MEEPGLDEFVYGATWRELGVHAQPGLRPQLSCRERRLYLLTDTCVTDIDEALDEALIVLDNRVPKLEDVYLKNPLRDRLPRKLDTCCRWPAYVRTMLSHSPEAQG